MSAAKKPPKTREAYRTAISAGEPLAMARLITMLESTRDDQAQFGQDVLEQLIPATGGAIRVGITGPPGAGKSTLIEALGLVLVKRGLKVAVLAVDPTSPVTGGSILGDKTRMEMLAREPNAFIRPSPSGASLGGVAQRTREVMLVCEAAGYDVVLVETVGIGQSQVAVAGMVDFFLLLLLPAGGDELQGIKKGVVELADGLVVNKADGSTEQAAESTRIDYASALQVIRSTTAGWTPPVLKSSAQTGAGVSEIWDVVLAHRANLEKRGLLDERRRRQARAWMWTLVEGGLATAFRAHPGVASQLERLEREVEALETTPAAAARTLLQLFQQD